MKTEYELITLFGMPMLFADWRIADSEVPDRLYKYEVRHDDDQRGYMCEISNHILVNFLGTVLSKNIVRDEVSGADIGDTGVGITIGLDDYNYTGDTLTVEEYLENYTNLLDESQADEGIVDSTEKLKACTTACSLINLLDSINDSEFVDEVINCVANNDAFTRGQLITRSTGQNNAYSEEEIK